MTQATPLTPPLTPLQTTLALAPLGKASQYIDHYAPTLLYPIPRAGKRQEIGIDTTQGTGQSPFFGADMWTAFELSWLNPRGKPQVALAHITVPCESPNIIESKSFKLYLNSFNNHVFSGFDEVASVLKRDLSRAAFGNPHFGNQQTESGVGVRLVPPDMFDAQPVFELDGLSLDRLDIDCSRYTPAPDLLTTDASRTPVSEVLVSRLLKSNCLVTGQPDWGSVQISYSGQPINQEALLQYIVSFRNHNEFHEQCVERIFMDIWTRCKPTKLSVYARYTRRGGLDINPYRTSYPAALPANNRTARQ
jgi:7-cyano-7-deazaguanine reductase